MYCPYCGHQHENGLLSCQNCGADLQQFNLAKGPANDGPFGWWPGMFVPSVQDRKWAIRMALLALFFPWLLVYLFFSGFYIWWCVI